MTFSQLTPKGGLLCVHAHPDDETLTNGGLMALWRAAGLPVTLVTCTRGEQGEVIGDDPLGLEGNATALGAYREIELGVAMEALGVDDFLFLDEIAAGHRYVDSGMAWVGSDSGSGVSGTATVRDSVPKDAFSWADVEDAARLLASVIRDRAPEFVVTYEPGGGYGHPDHVQTFRVVLRAMELVSMDGDVAVPTLLSAVVPRSVAVSARQTLVDLAQNAGPSGSGSAQFLESAVVLPLDAPFPSMVCADHEDILGADVSVVLPQVLGAMRAHATQIQWATTLEGSGLIEAPIRVVGTYALSNDIIAPILSHEFFRIVSVLPGKI